MAQAPPAPSSTNGNVFTFEQLTYVDELKKGRFDLQWLKDPKPNWGIRAQMRNPNRGLTLQDINNAYDGRPRLRRARVIDLNVRDTGVLEGHE